MIVKDPFPGPDSIGLPRDRLAHIALLARAFEGQAPPVDPDDGSNPSDDRSVAALEPGPNNLIGEELRDALISLNEEQRAAVTAVVWVGRGDFEPEEWEAALAAARERRKDGPTHRYLMGVDLLGDYIEEGAARLGFSLTEEESDELHHPAGEPPAEDDRD